MYQFYRMPFLGKHVLIRTKAKNVLEQKHMAQDQNVSDLINLNIKNC